jgi:hypothetical protein
MGDIPQFLEFCADEDGLIVSSISGLRKIPAFAPQFIEEECHRWIPNAHVEVLHIYERLPDKPRRNPHSKFFAVQD